VTHLKERIAAADAVVFATPEYNHSIPGQLKNAMDWVSRPLADTPLKGKPVAVIGASTGMFGAVWAQAELRKVLEAIGAKVLDRELPVPLADEIVRDREKLESSGTHSLIVGILAELLEAARPVEAAAAA
jgi:chromate reductase